MWISGADSPSTLDVNRFSKLKSSPTQDKHPKAYAWYARMSSMTEAQLKAIHSGAADGTSTNTKALHW